MSREKRQAKRFVVSLPLELKQGAGLTRDISHLGAYFETDQPASAGETIEFIIPFDDQGTDPLRLRFRGKVIRVESFVGKNGVAVAFMDYSFERA
ncbi:MAG: PilZ domain-containing protein [Nitrospirales bacterium]|nr:PilZ domain-containing protein [Nitrospirales bacterium]